MAQLRVGCAMWAHRAWAGRWLPPSRRPGDELTNYARSFTAVEGNTTFYALPQPGTVNRWLQQTSEQFRFNFKLPQIITHQLRLRDADRELAEFVDRVSPLGRRLGAPSIQLPASFGPDHLDALANFLLHAPGALGWAVEVRHPSFFDGSDDMHRLHDLLRRHGADKVILDSRALFAGPSTTPAEIEAFRQKPRLPVRPTVTGRRPIVRFIGQSTPVANETFWAPWVETIIRWLDDGLEPTVFIHTPDNNDAPGLVRRFHAQIVAARPSTEPLPEPDQDLRLFP